MQYDANELNVFDISRNLSWLLLLRLVIVYTMMSQGQLQIEAVNFEARSSKIFPEYLIRLTFELNISKKT